jgi:hypothetical protein
MKIGHGTCGHIHPSFDYLHRFRHPYKINTSMVSLVELDKSSGVWLVSVEGDITSYS